MKKIITAKNEYQIVGTGRRLALLKKHKQENNFLVGVSSSLGAVIFKSHSHI
jgi:hypothetical protein